MYRYGKKLIKVYENYENAELLVAEKILAVKSIWTKLEIQIEFVNRIWNSLDERLQTIQLDCIKVLERRLRDAANEFDGILGEREIEADMLSIWGKKGKLKKGKFALRAHDHLEKMIEELESWHRRFDLSWWLTLRIPDGSNRIEEEIDATSRNFGQTDTRALRTMQDLRTALHNPPTDMELHPRLSERQISDYSLESQTTLVSPSTRNGGSIFLSENLVLCEKVELKYSPCQYASIDENDYVIIDHLRPDERVKPKSLVQSVRDLARVLSKVDAMTFGLMTCHGVMKVFENREKQREPELVGFDLIFSVPLPLRCPRSLREVLLSSTFRVPLNQWFNFARQLARSVFFVHTANFVHKNIRPETILCFHETNHDLGKPFLVGFEQFRLEKGTTHQFGDDIWERNMYRHPQRQGLHPEESYIMQHDIYSLGVVLLEIGLKTSFVTFHGLGETAGLESSISPLLRPELQKRIGQGSDTGTRHMIWTKNYLCALAEDELPALMGLKYTGVVLSCLTCLDINNGYFGEESDLQDKDGIHVGVRYIEKVSPAQTYIPRC